ncbi:GYF domain-containing protein [Flavobacterium granuli]|uniref:Uncharacterized protein DUF4339 n=1 Tax=Flavobacterium granuli TaxID=280093 RepID=A0A1M5Q170_9FLAO|nr:GYF domain-containing protein [Flavobacterium granuli]PRZ22027.1 uncharacterized protein DUF4339 [Flavobacterium granuli]SHH07656.1 protein of unknown function [Flavobacterium granuli]
MNTYYLHDGNESSGPFGLEELKTKKITSTTPVWCQGMVDWKNAGEVPELRSLLMIVPPPIKVSAPIPEVEKIKKNHLIFGIKRSYFYLASTLLLLIIGTFIFNIVRENRRADLELKNRITEKDNQQYLIQQKEIEQQKKLLAEQEQMEAERIAREKKETITNRLLEIQNTLSDNNNNLEIFKKKLIDASDFKFFRTAEEKREEINLIHNQIQSLKKDIEKLEQENNQLKLELERVH